MAETTAGEMPTPPDPAEMAGQVQNQSPDELKAELEKVREALKETNRKSAADRHRLKELESQERDRKDSELSEMEKRDNRLKELEALDAQSRQALLDTRLEVAVERAARDAGFEYPEDVFKLIDRESIEVEDGKIRMPTVKKAVDKLAADRPRLLTGKKNGTPERGRTSSQAGGDHTEDTEYQAQRSRRTYGFS
jgi:hypothetical protein